MANCLRARLRAVADGVVDPPPAGASGVNAVHRLPRRGFLRLAATAPVVAATGCAGRPKPKVATAQHPTGPVTTAHPASVGTPRTWPDTTGRIVPLSDQFSGNMPAAVADFSARHYAGTQKILPDLVQRLRAVNPDFLALHYRLGVGAGPVQYIVNGRWGSDFATVNPHTDWFKTWNGKRDRQVRWNWYLMDIRNHGWRDYWASSTMDQMRAVGYDGVFADSVTVDVYYDSMLDNPDPDFRGTAARTTGWTTALSAYLAHMRATLNAAPEGFLYLPNLGGMITSWDDTDYGAGDGGMCEGFAGAMALSDWRLQMNRVLALAREAKVVIAQHYLNSPGDVQDRMFTLGCHLLTMGRRSYINTMGGSGGYGAFWWPEYGIDLGAPAKDLPADVTAYRDATGLYRRDFAKGYVLVNPGPASVTVPIRKGKAARPTGGGPLTEGDLDANGNYIGGTLDFEMVETLTLPGRSAAVILA